MTQSHIVEINVPREESDRIITGKIIPALIGEDKHSVIIALLSLSLSLMKPELTSDELVSGVQGMSEWACLHLSLNETIEEGKTLQSSRRFVN